MTALAVGRDDAAVAVPAAGPLIKVDQVSLAYSGRLVLDHVSLALQPGEIVTLIGPNGCGKTSLLKILLGLIKPTRGSLWRRPDLRIGYLPQKLTIERSLPMTARRFLHLAGAGRRAPLTAPLINRAIAETGISQLIDRQVHDLSGGEMQRLALARALLHDPHLLVLDEPLQGVDFSGQLDFYELIDRLSRSHGCAVLLVSHDLHLVMARTDRVICLNHHICCEGKPEAVGRDPSYLHLFGPRAAADLAVYVHHHDHDHDLAGDVVGSCQHGHGQGRGPSHDHHHSDKQGHDHG